MKADKTPSMMPHGNNLPDLHGLVQMCRRVRFGTLEHVRVSDGAHHMDSEGVVIHCQMPLDEFDDLSNSPEAAIELRMQAYAPGMPSLLVNIETPRHLYRWTLPLWQPMVGEWLQAPHAEAPELLVTCSHGQESLSLFVTLSPESRQLLLSEHQRTVRDDDRYSVECTMHSGIRSMVEAEVHNSTQKPLCHFIVTSPEVEAILFDVYRSAASQVEQVLDVSALSRVH